VKFDTYNITLQKKDHFLNLTFSFSLSSGFYFETFPHNTQPPLLHGARSFCRTSAHAVGVGNIYDRVLSELVNKMKEMKMDKTELGCLRAIILYNPGIRRNRLSPTPI
jgi:hypothetical protein